MNFTNRIAVVTGASCGIGRATAIKLAMGGAKLALVDIKFNELLEVKEELKSYTEDVLVFNCDVSDEKAVNEVVRSVEEKWGCVDILVNNAAIWRTWKPFVEVTTEEWLRFINVNVMSVVYFTRAVMPKMIEKHFGRIINITSVAGVNGNMNMSHYSATKAAVIAMTKSIAKEVAADGVLINCVSPGSVSPSENKDVNHYVESELSYMGRTGTDMENANLICFLASDEASYISGENIMIDGCRKKL